MRSSLTWLPSDPARRRHVLPGSPAPRPPRLGIVSSHPRLAGTVDPIVCLPPMRAGILHMLVCLLLMVLYVGERAMPCGEACAVSCAAEEAPVALASSVVSSAHQADHDTSRHDQPGESHHCSHCVCPCHAAAVITGQTSWSVAQAPSIPRAPSPNLPPSAPVDPIDHVPLA